MQQCSSGNPTLAALGCIASCPRQRLAWQPPAWQRIMAVGQGVVGKASTALPGISPAHRPDFLSPPRVFAALAHCHRGVFPLELATTTLSLDFAISSARTPTLVFLIFYLTNLQKWAVKAEKVRFPIPPLLLQPASDRDLHCNRRQGQAPQGAQTLTSPHPARPSRTAPYTMDHPPRTAITNRDIQTTGCQEDQQGARRGRQGLPREAPRR